MGRIAIFFALAAAASLPAQVSAATDNPQVVIGTLGPDAWRVRLGPTNFGSMLESEKGRALWGPRLQPLFSTWQRLAGSEAAHAASRTRLLEYGGRIRTGLWYDASGRGGEDAACIAIVLERDGRSDLAAIAGDLRTTLYEAIPGEWADLEHGGSTLAVRRNPWITVTAPLLENDAVLVAAWRKGTLEAALQRARAFAAAPAQPIAPGSPVLRVDVDCASLVAGAMANEKLGHRAWMQALGLGTLGTASFSLSTAGPRLQFEYTQRFLADERGLFGGLMPDTAAMPSLLAATPESGNWIAGHLGFAKLHQAILDGIAASQDTTPAAARADFDEWCGIDVATDMLPHMTDQVMLWLPESGELLTDIFTKPWVFTVRLRDEAAFASGLFAMLRHRDQLSKRVEPAKHDEVAIHHLRWDVRVAVGRGVFVFASGRDAEEHIGTMLDRCVGLPETLPPERSLPANFAPLKRFLPPGCHGLSASDAAMALHLPEDVAMVLSLFVSLPDFANILFDLDLDGNDAEAMAELLREHRLDVVRSATGYAERTWRWRTFW